MNLRSPMLRAVPAALVLLALLVVGWPLRPLLAADQPQNEPPPEAPKLLYLTFDDGPSPYTQQILDVLARHNAKATFFVLGRQANGRQDFIHAIYDAGHGIANHSYNHPSLPALNQQRFKDEVQATSTVLDGLDHGCLRPPYGASSKSVRANAAELGYTLVTWTVDPRDWTRPGAAAIAARVIAAAQPGGIVVMHDGGGDRSQTVAALEVILTQLGAQGYRFAALCRDGAPVPNTPTQQPQPGMQPDILPDTLQPPPAAAVRQSVAGITRPPAGSEVHGTLVVLGFATHPAFSKWQLDLLIDGVQETFLALGEKPVPLAAYLATWDTAAYPNGNHLLRLRVVYAGSNYDEYITPITIRN